MLLGRTKRRPATADEHDVPSWRAWATAALVLVASVLVAGCGGLSFKSSCKDYLSASAEEQTKVVNKLAAEYNAPNAAGIGQPNVNNACIRSPNTTVGSVVYRYRKPPPGALRDDTPSSDDSPASQDGVQQTSDPAPLHLLRTSPLMGFVPKLETRGSQYFSNQFTSGGREGGVARDLITTGLTRLSQKVNFLPDGVTVEDISGLLDSALITQTPPNDYNEPAACVFCNAERIKADDTIPEYYSWVVTFPPEGETPEQYFDKLQAEYGSSSGDSDDDSDDDEPTSRGSVANTDTPIGLVKAYLAEDDGETGCALFGARYIEKHYGSTSACEADASWESSTGSDFKTYEPSDGPTAVYYTDSAGSRERVIVSEDDGQLVIDETGTCGDPGVECDGDPAGG